MTIYRSLSEKIQAQLRVANYHYEDGVFVSQAIELTSASAENQDVFSRKWNETIKHDTTSLEKIHREWYLDLYGFESEEHLKSFLQDKEVILDAGCGYGHKAAWFAELAPNCLIIAMDFSEAVLRAKELYSEMDNMLFVRADIANTGLADDSLDYISCDQVLHHTSSPPDTLLEYARILKTGQQAALYVYSKKALPRELLDSHFIDGEEKLNHEDLMELSEKITEIGKTLSNLNIKIDVPEIKALGIEKGNYDLQRFFYYNFFKCYWNEEMGQQQSIFVNYDWYGPKVAFRYTWDEFQDMCKGAGFELFSKHSEEACHSGRFVVCKDLK